MGHSREREGANPVGRLDDTLYLVRTQGFGKMARLLAERLAAAGAAVAAVVDERRGVAQTTPFAKVTMSDEQLCAMGFSGLPEDWRWLCGDLCYVAAVDAFPGFKHYALIESDVYLPEAAAAPLIKALAAHSADAIAAQLGPSNDRRRYSRGLMSLGLDPTWGCIFPLSRVNCQVIEEMRKLRIEQLANAPNERLNDEAILAGAILRRGFSYARLEDVIPERVTSDTFHTNPPHLFEALEADPDTFHIYHPVVPFDTVMERLRTGEKAYSRRRLRNVLNTAPMPMKKAIQTFMNGNGGQRVNKRPDLLRINGLVLALAPNRRLRILDVGANPLIEGEVSYQRLLDQGHAEVVGFEPQAQALKALDERTSDVETYLPYALGDGSIQTLRLTRASGFTSIFPADAGSAALLGFGEEMAEMGTDTVQTHRLDDLAEVPEVDFLKIDVQGSETAVIANGRIKLAHAIAVQTEVRLFSIYLGEPSYGELEQVLAEQGFRFLRFGNLKQAPLSRRRYHKRLRRGEFSQFIDGDAFFVRDLRKIGDWSDEAIKRLAILADGVMDCSDLTVFALDQLVLRRVVDPEVIEVYLSKLPPERCRS